MTSKKEKRNEKEMQKTSSEQQLVLMISCPIPNCERKFYYSAKPTTRTFLAHLKRDHNDDPVLHGQDRKALYKEQVKKNVRVAAPMKKSPNSSPVVPGKRKAVTAEPLSHESSTADGQSRQSQQQQQVGGEELLEQEPEVEEEEGEEEEVVDVEASPELNSRWGSRLRTFHTPVPKDGNIPSEMLQIMRKSLKSPLSPGADVYITSMRQMAEKLQEGVKAGISKEDLPYYALGLKRRPEPSDDEESDANTPSKKRKSNPPSDSPAHEVFDAEALDDAPLVISTPEAIAPPSEPPLHRSPSEVILPNSAPTTTTVLESIPEPAPTLPPLIYSIPVPVSEPVNNQIIDDSNTLTGRFNSLMKNPTWLSLINFLSFAHKNLSADRPKSSSLHIYSPPPDDTENYIRFNLSAIFQKYCLPFLNLLNLTKAQTLTGLAVTGGREFVFVFQPENIISYAQQMFDAREKVKNLMFLTPEFEWVLPGMMEDQSLWKEEVKTNLDIAPHYLNLILAEVTKINAAPDLIAESLLNAYIGYWQYYRSKACPACSLFYFNVEPINPAEVDSENNPHSNIINHRFVLATRHCIFCHSDASKFPRQQ